MADTLRSEIPISSIRNASESSRVVTTTRTTLSVATDAWSRSWSHRFLGEILHTLVNPATRWFIRTTNHSYLYRWLTKEPEPEVIVIDLRETWTVGPLIALLDHMITAGTPAATELNRIWRASTLYRLGDWVAGWIERGLETRVGQLLIELLEPPELPEDERE